MKPDTSTAVRGLELLWGATERPSRGPKQGLTSDAVVRAAIELADADGLAALSMRKVAERLGVGAMTLYTYVPAKDELVALMVDAALGERPVPVGEGWRELLASVARGLWELYLRHPWLLAASSERTPIGPNALVNYERELSTLSGTGLDSTAMVSVISLVAGYVAGAARSAVQVIEEERRTGQTREEWWHQTSPVLDRLIDYASYPTVVSVADADSHAHGPAENFAFGLERVLDGIEALIATRR
ncbi:TetR family transcriptional regulator [Actinorhabdospora filicis]|uniref:TetR family transcriptional regulator n=1 Tax=Actinorhabdospora filicis TaxID=1785913 RepID=A0A9W6SKF4_9ACTN|nr:TetR/AcrR family transcriptional regulator [Actinorhabdospora filicis]GLZ78640.1 TetR family transcriptional regulator [Actinorhabdospora filicis]